MKVGLYVGFLGGWMDEIEPCHHSQPWVLCANEIATLVAIEV